MLTKKAQTLIEWNDKNLIHSADLKKSDLPRFFAEKFKVVANGVEYEADYESYFEFLNKFRSHIQSLTHVFHELIENQDYVALGMDAQIIRMDGSKENFAVNLILKFNAQGQVTLWREVYVPRQNQN